MNSFETNFLQTTQQLAGNESINTTRLLSLNSKQASAHYNTTDLGWVVPKSHKRSYLQQKIIMQKFHMWHTFKSVPEDVDLYIVPLSDKSNPPDPTKLIHVPIFKANWTEDALAAYISDKIKAATTASLNDGVVVTYDPYQLQFCFCGYVDPNTGVCEGIALDASSTANKYLGFRDGAVARTNTSHFPPVALKGPTCINVYTNFNINNIPVSNFLTCIPIQVPYGYHIYYDNNDNSEAVLSLDNDLQFIRLTLRDEEGRPLEYPDNLVWEAQLGLQSTIPDGFSPLAV
jgi:hypothetical protein